MPDTKRGISELKSEGRIELSIGYDHFKNCFYYRNAISIDFIEEDTIEKNALNELTCEIGQLYRSAGRIFD